ncbi:MAG TPA: phosphoglucosamine mutase [Gemmatimonadales bacterium]|nr:phosphoglucosamine mutase [Gemmatimonadales bacterium]
MTDTLMISVSGIRGLVGKDLTPEMVARWAAAFGTWAKAGRPVRIILGRDARTSGPMFAQAATAGLNSVGCDVIDVGLVATPTVQLAVEHHRAAGGIMLTASHNPIEWNALKFVGPDGIFLDTQSGTRVRELAAGENNSLQRANYNAIGGVEADSDAISRHLAAVLALRAVDVKAIKRRRFHVALDTVRGAGGAVMPALLEQLGCRVTAINLETDGLFPRPPEPVPENLKALGALVRRSKADVGIAVDPDVDRLAIVDEKGRPIGEDYTLAFAIRAVLGRPDGDAATRPVRGRGRAVRPSGRQTVVCNLSTSLVVEDAAKELGAKVVRAPVGEAHVARKIIELDAVIGGEGNGGVMYPALHVGRDAPVAGALLLGLLARERVTVSELVARAPRYTIVKAKVERGPRLDTVYAALRRQFAEAQVDTQDGLRLSWPDRWLHVRPSGTEPIIRLIAEAPSGADAQRLIDEGRRLCAAS